MFQHGLSLVLYRCCSNTLKLNDRNRFQGESTKCIACDESVENLNHFILDCPLYQNIRIKSRLFLQPYNENWVAELLFNAEIDKEEVKSVLYEFWKKREKYNSTN